VERRLPSGGSDFQIPDALRALYRYKVRDTRDELRIKNVSHGPITNGLRVAVRRLADISRISRALEVAPAVRTTRSSPLSRLTCGEVATRVGHRFLALVDGVGLHLVAPAGCEFLGRQLQRLVAVQRVAALEGQIREAQHPDPEARVATRSRGSPRYEGTLAGAQLDAQVGWRIGS